MSFVLFCFGLAVDFTIFSKLDANCEGMFSEF